MKLNDYEVIDRNKRPNVLSRTALRVLFFNDGAYADPEEISGVTIFKASENWNPSSILDENCELLASSLVSSQILMHFEAPGTAYTSSTAFDTSNYSPSVNASGIFRQGVGDYIVILDGQKSLSGLYSFYGSGLEVKNGASGVNDYLDGWTIRFAGDSDFQTYINEFSLKSDTIFTTTQPLLIKTRSMLTTKRVKLGSKQELKLTNALTVENDDISNEIKNIFKGSVISDVEMRIQKSNQDNNLPARVVVADWADTSATIQVSSKNTVSYLWDTSLLSVHSRALDGTLGSLTGSYSVQIRFNLLDETIYSDLFHCIVR